MIFGHHFPDLLLMLLVLDVSPERKSENCHENWECCNGPANREPDENERECVHRENLLHLERKSTSEVHVGYRVFNPLDVGYFFNSA